jgi:hypothetical protein
VPSTIDYPPSKCLFASHFRRFGGRGYRFGPLYTKPQAICLCVPQHLNNMQDFGCYLQENTSSPAAMVPGTRQRAALHCAGATTFPVSLILFYFNSGAQESQTRACSVLTPSGGRASVSTRTRTFRPARSKVLGLGSKLSQLCSGRQRRAELCLLSALCWFLP